MNKRNPYSLGYSEVITHFHNERYVSPSGTTLDIKSYLGI